MAVAGVIRVGIRHFGVIDEKIIESYVNIDLARSRPYWSDVQMTLDRTSIIRVLVANRGNILSYIYGICRDMHQAEDVFQDMIVAASEDKIRARDEEHVMAWARRASRHAIIDRMRKGGGRTRVLDGDVLSKLELSWSRHDREDQASVIEALKACCDALPPRAAQLIHLRYQQALRGREIAERLNRPRESIYASLSRIYRDLAECVRRRMREVGGG